MKKTLSFLVLLLALLGGCATPASLIFGGAGAAVQAYVYWKEGEGHKYYKQDAEIMYRATKRALAKLNLPLKTDQQVPPSKHKKGVIPGHKLLATSNDKFKIRIISREARITEVAIRIDFMGDKPYAELVYATIDDELCKVEFPK